jgi:hydrogenase-4 component F
MCSCMDWPSPVFSSSLGELPRLMARRPGLANPFIAAMAALVGMPPFALFFTEVAIVFAGFQRGLGGIMVVVVLLLLINFAGLVRHSTLMFFGRKNDSADALDEVDHSWHGPRIPIIAALTIAIIIPFLTGFGQVLSKIADVLAVSQ